MDNYVSSHGSYYVPAAVFNAVPIATGISSKTRWKTSSDARERAGAPSRSRPVGREASNSSSGSSHSEEA